MRRFISFLGSVLFTLFAVTPVRSEMSDLRNMMLPAIMTGDFAKLEEMADQCRNKETRFPDGEWTLAYYYGTFDVLMSGDQLDQQLKQWTNTYEKWREAYPTSPTPVIAHARVLVAHAWSIRGNGVASDVWKQDHDKFAAEIVAAKALLENNRNIASKDPQWYAALTTIYQASGAPLDERVALVNEASDKFPYYYPTYYAALDALHPKWRGSYEAMRKLVGNTVERTEAQDGQSLYARYYLAMIDDADTLRDNPPDMALLKRGANELLERYPDVSNIQRVSKLACQLRDAEWAKERWAALAPFSGPTFSKEINPASTCGWAVRRALQKPWEHAHVVPEPEAAPYGIKPLGEDFGEQQRLAQAILEKTFARGSVEALKQSAMGELRDGRIELPDLIIESWEQAVASEFSVDRMILHLKASLSNSLTADELNEVAKFYSSPVGMKIAEAEDNFSRNQPAALSDVQGVDNAFADLKRDRERFFAINDITGQVQSDRSLSDTVLAKSLGASVAIQGLASDGSQPRSAEELWQALERERPQIASQSGPLRMASFHLCYSAFSTIELKQYVAFLQTTAGRKYVAASVHAMGEALLAEMYGVGREASRKFKDRGI